MNTVTATLIECI